ncbi:MAG TPA: SGNH/GDSL hydrolase family protein [Oscillatoriales cyanobacterium M59_W2019_021]|nr:MAG: SGNH/GDSL hydrolase family protein [Cyanobacteria bacterium J055]HIK31807.1 SGNH/GDSL hydrolase family protein [Oscillatoriales cyanobacterium M4454_W2019_049]HIK52853.1 SGNH/GDSL hydrolase family protein [Oscillatoriales cyanobacterium M59_W2019_021]
MEKIVLWAIAVLVGAISFGELGLRLFFGFGNPLLYIGDDRIGYLLAPNQDTRRFGNRIRINRYSMRGAQIAPTPEAGTLRVLLLGDSIANGGWWTDDDETIAAIVARQLQQKGRSPVEVPNASAHSWGPRNEFAYLQQFGHFQSDAVVLLINTDDLFATAPTALPVGRDRNYPERRPWCAWAEVFGRYLLPAPAIPELEAVRREGGDQVGKNLAAIAMMHEMLTAAGIPLVVAMTPLRRELESGSRDYERVARQRLLELTQELNLLYLDFLPEFQALPPIDRFYRDTIHLSHQGNQLISERIARAIETLLLH